MAEAPPPPPLLLIAAILAALSVASTVAISDTPFILAHKRAVVTKLHHPDSERVSVTIDVYNHGQVTALGVSLTDETWSSEVFDVVTGNTSISWRTLDGGSHVSHSFELVPKWRTVYYGAPALITFRVPLKSRLLKAYSTPILPVHTLADEVKINKLQLAQEFVAKYSSHVSVILIVGVFAHILVFPAKSNGATVKKKKN